MIQDLKADLDELSDTEKSVAVSRYFKTGKGEYGEGDVFLGVSVPEQRRLSKKYKDISYEELQELLRSKIHEHRLTALLIMVEKYKENNDKVANMYLDNTENVNNWDLVDLSAPKILGEYLKDKSRDLLYNLAVSDNLWERRIAIVSTHAFIRNDDFGDTLKISELLLQDKEDLIHKAAGWMLREIGKRNVKVLEDFLDRHCKEMPRTMLRYSIEKFDDEKRKYYMKR